MDALLLIKGNSARLPGKNFKDLCGKPLWKHSTDKMKGIGHTFIITDETSHDLIPDADDYTKIKRPLELSGNDISSIDVILGILDKIPCEDFILLQASQPLITDAVIRYCIRQYRHYNMSNLITINPYTCKPDGNLSIIKKDLFKSEKSIQTDELWLCPTCELNILANDIDFLYDLKIANAILHGRIIDIKRDGIIKLPITDELNTNNIVPPGSKSHGLYP